MAAYRSMFPEKVYRNLGASFLRSGYSSGSKNSEYLEFLIVLRSLLPSCLTKKFATTPYSVLTLEKAKPNLWESHHNGIRFSASDGSGLHSMSNVAISGTQTWDETIFPDGEGGVCDEMRAWFIRIAHVPAAYPQALNVKGVTT